MLKKSIKYVDFNGVEREEDFYFNISKAEAAEMELSTDGGLTNMIQRIVSAQDNPTIIKIFKEFILKAYGEKSPDGRLFEKSEALSKAFTHTEAYNVLYMELLSDAKKAAEFIEGLMPADMRTPADDKVLTPVDKPVAEEDGNAHLLNVVK
jgi:hypothetical protein